jgi:anti-anti-sigma factor
MADLRDLGFIDASGLRVLMAVRRTIGTGGRVFLRRHRPMVRRVFALAGLDGADGFEHEPEGDATMSAAGSSTRR